MAVDPNEQVEGVEIHILGKKKYPITQVNIPARMATELPEYLRRAIAINPTYDYQQVVASIWELGLRKLNGNLARGILKEKSE